jgi:hypothetical protein
MQMENQNEKTACTKMRLAAEPWEKIPPAMLVDFPKFDAVTVPFG